MGPMTGRGAGYCGGYDAPGWAGPMPGRDFGVGGGRGRARGGGRGWRQRNWYHATGLPGWARFGYEPAWDYGPRAGAPSREQEVEFLRQQAEWLKQELEAVGRRIDELGQEGGMG